MFGLARGQLPQLAPLSPLPPSVLSRNTPNANPGPLPAPLKLRGPKPAKNLAEERRSVYAANWNRRVKTEIPVQFNMTLEKDAVAGELVNK